MATAKLSTKAIGSIVKIKENGTAVNFIVLKHGYPSDGNGRTLLLRESLYDTRQWHTSNVNAYASSAIDTWLTGTYLNLIDSDIRAQIAAVNIPYTIGNGNTTTTTLSRKVFLLSGTEVGFTHSYMKTEGTALSFFNSNAARIAYLNGTATRWWLRSPYTSGTANAWRVYTDGTYNYGSCSNSYGSRPAFTLPSSLSVSDDGSVQTNQPPTAPTSITLPATIKGGQTFAISWSGASDPDGNLQGYYVERQLDGSGPWSQIYQGSASNTTDIITFGTADTVQYRVRAYDTAGETSAWYTSGSATVINNTAPSAPSSITVPLQVIGGEKLTVSWAASQDSEGNLSGYKLERSVAGGAWTQIYTGSNLSYTDSITKGWASVAYRVKAYDALGDESEYTTSQTREVDNNTAPTITCEYSGDLGEKSAGFSISYSVDDVDGDVVTVVEEMDSTQKRSYTATLGANNSFTVTGDYFMNLLNGSHTMKITATDAAGKSTSLTLTFTKAVHALRITLDTPMTTDALITKTVMNIVRSIPGDAEFKVLVTNNANDPSPVWEDITSNVQSGLNYLFENTSVANGNAFNFIITANRGASGQGGYISSIGGAFE